MRAIDADALKNSVLKWLPPDPCGQEEKEYPFETDICVSMIQEIDRQPTIEPQPEPEEFEWCNTCKEYDQDKHCCHRWTKVIRETVEEFKQSQNIIHCKDCKHIRHWDRKECSINDRVVEDDDYCSWAERRQDG